MDINISDLFRAVASQYPQKPALVIPQTRGLSPSDLSITFNDLAKDIDRLVSGLSSLGIGIDSRVILFIPPSFEFPAVTFALFRLGAIPIFIDPGMGINNLISAAISAHPTAVIAVPKAFAYLPFKRLLWKNFKIKISIGMTPVPGVMTLNQVRNLQNPSQVSLGHGRLATARFATVADENDKLAAILFTSGGTGPAKGVPYTHKIFIAQTFLLRDMFSLTANDKDFPCFPLFSLFTLSLGLTVIVPDLDPSRPATANPVTILRQILRHQPNFASGSPSIWEKVADYALSNQLTLPSIKALAMFGAPVSNDIHYKFKRILCNGSTYTPYGATEFLPLSNISGTEIIKYTAELTSKGRGTCVGFPVPGIEVKIINISDQPIERLADTTQLEVNMIGEIIATGPVITRSYDGLPAQTALAKIHQRDILWHRMGDLGYLDVQGRLWFCGRKSHTVKFNHNNEEVILFSDCCEAIFNQHEEVKKCALIALATSTDGKKSITPAIVIERIDRKILKGRDRIRFERELLALGMANPHTRMIHTFFYCNKFPVDIRHNIKIDRLLLAKMASLGNLAGVVPLA